MASPYSLPSIGTLFKESWQAFCNSFVNLLALLIITIGFTFIWLIGFVLILILGGIGVGTFRALSGSGPSIFSGISPLTLIIIGGLLFFFFLVYLFVQTAISIAYTLCVAHYQERPSLKHSIRQGMNLVLPFLLTNLVVAFFIFGGLFAFILPAILFGFLFMFVYYEVVLANKRFYSAVKGSYQIISQHFGAILIRSLLYLFLYFLVGILIPGAFQDLAEVATENFPHIFIILTLISGIIRTLLSWFGLAFTVTLYKQARQATDFERKPSLLWVWILTLLGWLIFGALVVFFVIQISRHSSQFKDAFWSEFEKGLEISKIQESREMLSSAPSSCGLSVPIPDTTDVYQDRERKWLYEEVPLDTKGFYILDSDVYPVKKLLGAFIAYKDAQSRLRGATFYVSYPGLNIYCVDNYKNLNLEEYKSLALANKNFKVTADENIHWGEIELVPVWLEGTYQGEPLKEPAYLAVSQDNQRLIYIRIWGIAEEDPLKDTLEKDTDFIRKNLQYRNVSGSLDKLEIFY